MQAAALAGGSWLGKASTCLSLVVYPQSQQQPLNFLACDWIALQKHTSQHQLSMKSVCPKGMQPMRRVTRMLRIRRRST